jgi:hypothetical protein
LFDPSTKELHRGKEGKKESKSEKEKVIWSFDAIRVLKPMGFGFECCVSVWRLDTSSRLLLVKRGDVIGTAIPRVGPPLNEITVRACPYAKLHRLP